MPDVEPQDSPSRLAALVAGLVAAVIGVVALIQLAGIAGDLRRATDRLEECNTPAPSGEDPRGRCFEENQERARAFVIHIDEANAAYAFCARHHADLNVIKACAAQHVPPLPEAGP